jgi:hypothetical protein
MLRKYYNHVVAKEDEAKKDGGDRGAGGFPTMENVFLIFGGGGSTVDMSSSQRKRELNEVLTIEKAPPSLIGHRRPSPLAVRITRTASPTRACTRWSSTLSSATRGSPRC